MAPRWEIDPDTGERHFIADGPVVYTGPITGTVQTADGTTYDVTHDYVAVRSDEHAAEVAALIGQRFVEEGHPKVDGEFRLDAPAENPEG